MALTTFLIDDDADDHEIFEIALSKLNMKVKHLSASDGCEALEILEKDPELIPDFIFLDVNMPKMGGKECLPRIKEIPRLQNTPIYMYSTSTDHRDELHMISLGAKSFITKPSDINQLASILLNIFNVPQNVNPK